MRFVYFFRALPLELAKVALGTQLHPAKDARNTAE
jgi:hypothetical protein